MVFQPIASGQLVGQGGFMNQATHDSFIPTLWVDEIKRYLDNEFIMTQFLESVPDAYKFGKEIVMPTVGRLRVQQKVPNNALQIQQPKSGEWRMKVNYRPFVVFAVEDVLEIQSSYDAMSEYSREASYALAQDIDRWILALRPYLKKMGSVVQSQQPDGSGGFENAPLNQAALLAAKLQMEKRNVRMSDAVWLFSPSQHTSLLTIPEFISADYVSGRPTETGMVGTLYGAPVYVNNNIQKNSVDGVDLNAQIIDADPLLVPTPGFAKTTADGTIYSPWWPDPAYNGNPNGAGNHEVDVAHSLAENAYSGMLVKRGFAKWWQPASPVVEPTRLALYQTDALITGYPLLDTKVYREEHAVVIESYELY